MAEPILRVRGLVTSFRTERGLLRAVDGVSFDVPPGAVVGLVGESGCGKSVTALSILRLVPSPPGSIDGGSIELEGRDLLRLSPREMRSVRGNLISMIFQEPMTSLNPVYSVGWQIVEAIRLHQRVSHRQAWQRAVELLSKVGIGAAESQARAYPHELSGGQRQRVMIAMALASRPKLLLADEPTTALDVTIQAQILSLLDDLRRELGMSIVLITHDLGLVAERADEVLVMYAGVVVERATVDDLFARPRHPYTRGLLESLPARLDRPLRGGRESLGPGGGKRRLRAIEGVVPNLLDLRGGCRFADRCPLVEDACRNAEPPLADTGDGHFSRCRRWQELAS
jgi:oligopeptide/dipeptide ABC transporter ATP-binding protein